MQFFKRRGKGTGALLAPVGGCYHLLGPWEPLEGIRALRKIVMGGPQIDQNRGGSLFWSIYVLFEGPRQKSDRGSSKHSGSLLWSIWICRGPPPTPPPYFGQFGASPPPLSPVMVNMLPPAFINPCYGQFIINGGCGVILQHYSPYVALLWSIYHHLGALMPLYSNVCPYQPW